MNTHYYIQNRLVTRIYCITEETIFNSLSHSPIMKNDLEKKYIYITESLFCTPEANTIL